MMVNISNYVDPTHMYMARTTTLMEGRAVCAALRASAATTIIQWESPSGLQWETPLGLQWETPLGLEWETP